MKQIVLYLLLISVAHAQKPAAFVDSILNNRTLKIPAYNLAVTGNESKLLTMPFGKSDFLDTSGITALQDAEILSIDLVFTDYPAKLDLKPLNKSRFLGLIKLLPNAMLNPYTQWQVFRQMDGFDKETAKGMVHGFVINYRKKATRSETKKEIALIKTLTPEEIIIVPEPKKEEPKKKVNNWDIIHKAGRTKYLFYRDRQIKAIGPDKDVLLKEMVHNDSLFSISTTEAMRSRFVEGKDKELYKGKDSAYVLLYPTPEADTMLLKRMYKPRLIFQKDSSVISIFKRNRFKNMLVVADVTGSMSPYTSQLIQWLSDEANQQNLRSLVCFNDGDGKQTELKQLGNTGGVYGEKYENPVQISELIQRVMNKGSGGDTPENVCEALIKAIDLFKDYGDVVLIADSWAPARDIELASQISKPVKIIACGDFAPHADYVDIAFRTGGSIHLTDQDITGLSILATSKELTIRGRSYKLMNGRVVVALK
jgi:hypothetical protein